MYNHTDNKSNQGQKKTYINYVNEDIRAFNILLLSEDWEKLWIFSRKDALDKAKQAWLDLVQIWYNIQDKVSTCKIIDYWKYQYYIKKKEKEKKNSQKNKWIKEIKISYGIDKNDLDMKIEKAKNLLHKWYNIKVSLKLMWRENVFKDKSKQYMELFVDRLKNCSKSWWIKEENKWFSLVLFAKLR